VAGREVAKMTREALTESEKKCPEVVASVRELAQAAGSAYAQQLAGETGVRGQVFCLTELLS